MPGVLLKLLGRLLLLLKAGQVNYVRSAVRCQLGCNLSAQLPLVHFAVQLVSLTVCSAAACLLSIL